MEPAAASRLQSYAARGTSWASARATIALAAFLWTAGCGYVGGPLTPLANVPLPVTDLAAVQRGGIIIAHYTVPARTTEGVLIKTPLKLDVRIGTASDQFKSEEWASQATTVSDAKIDHGVATYQIPTRQWTGKEVVIGVRAVGSNGKTSDWSNYQTVKVVPPPEVPPAPVLTPTAAGVHVGWTGPGDQFRVMRRTGDEENFIVAQTGTGHEWTDTTTEFGKKYTYMMQALVDVGNQKVAESDFSKPAEITPIDTFPPAVPSGLHAETAPNSVTLGWEPDTEPDLAGYRVYRSVGDGPWQKLADVNAVPSYTDNAVEAGKTYHYAVSAIDKSNNESERSAKVDVVL